jgi:hypothetical protein
LSSTTITFPAMLASAYFKNATMPSLLTLPSTVFESTANVNLGSPSLLRHGHAGQTDTRMADVVHHAPASASGWVGHQVGFPQETMPGMVTASPDRLA